MSRIGIKPISVPAGVTVTIAENNVVTVKGPKGTLEKAFNKDMIIKQEGTEITVSRPLRIRSISRFTVLQGHLSITWLRA